MKRLLLIAVLLSAGLPKMQAQQIYDAEGHLIAYQYPDAKKDRYTYDSAWRLIKFEGRDGAVTQYRYATDGTMEVVSAPQS